MERDPVALKYDPCFTQVPDQELWDLAHSIDKDGQKYPITRRTGKILDGNNRYQAMRLLKWTQDKMKFVDVVMTDEEAVRFIFSVNLHRRHMNGESRRRVIEMRLADAHAAEQLAQRGGDRRSEDFKASTDALETETKIAQDLHVSRSTLQRARRAQREKEKPNKDPFGHTITPVAMPYWRRRKEAKDIAAFAKQLGTKIHKLNPHDPMWAAIPSLQGLEAKARAINHEFTEATPFCLCPACMGRAPENCRLCQTRGVVTKFQYQGVPIEIRRPFEEMHRRKAEDTPL